MVSLPDHRLEVIDKERGDRSLKESRAYPQEKRSLAIKVKVVTYQARL